MILMNIFDLYNLLRLL